MRMLVVYDIAEPKRLNRVAKILKDYGLRVQKSKFEIEVGPAALGILQARVGAVIEPEEDGVKYIPLCGACQAKTEVIGLGHFVDPDQEYYVL